MSRDSPHASHPDDRAVLNARRMFALPGEPTRGADMACRMYLNLCAIKGHQRKRFGRTCKVCGLIIR